LEARQIQKTGGGRRIDQEIKIAAVMIFTVDYGAEKTRVRHAAGCNNAADEIAVFFEDGRRLHGDDCTATVLFGGKWRTRP
jgi:hypothetical protein